MKKFKIVLMLALASITILVSGCATKEQVLDLVKTPAAQSIIQSSKDEIIDMVKSSDFMVKLEKESKIAATNNNIDQINKIHSLFDDKLSPEVVDMLLSQAYLLGYVEKYADKLPESIGPKVIETIVPALDTLVKAQSSKLGNDESTKILAATIYDVVKNFDYTAETDAEDVSDSSKKE